MRVQSGGMGRLSGQERRIPTTVNTCALERSVPELSVWWDPCPCGGYEKGRAELMRAMGLTERAFPIRTEAIPIRDGKCVVDVDRKSAAIYRVK